MTVPGFADQLTITVTVNAQVVERGVEARVLLVHWLRDELGLTGTHIGCNTSHCGACAVLIDGEPVKSCTVLAAQVDQAVVVTVEGLADDTALDPIRMAFVEQHGLQCGYCTPGILIATTALLARVPDPSEVEIREWLHGNLCRCTGYHNIVRAVQGAAQALRAGAVQGADVT